jgi:hypothetical protein
LSDGEVKALLMWSVAEQQMCLNVPLDFQMAYNYLFILSILLGLSNQ